MMHARYLYSLLAAMELIPFCRLTWPDPMAPADVSKSRFDIARHHSYVASKLEAVERGESTRQIIVMPRRHGKTELTVRRFVPWYCGRNPEKHVIVGTYSDTFAEEHGRAVRSCMVSPGYQLAFPEKRQQLRFDSQSSTRLQLEAGGVLSFVGRGGAITGKGCDLFILDDVLKDAEEARSQLIRDKLWQWFHTVVSNSFNDVTGKMILIGTRWHEDDLIGRITDPRNTHYDPVEAAKWKIIRLPALAEEGDELGRARDEALWPERLPASVYEQKRQSPDPTVKHSFQTMDQGKPTPDEGTFFKAEWLKTYKPEELPKRLRYYVASDHAVGIKQENDATCLVPAGVDEDGDIWILPEVWWERKASNIVVDAMIGIMRRYKPLTWWAENGHISKSIGPFLRKRMMEEKVFVAIDEVTPVADKQTRAQSFQGRCSMKRVHFPGFATWWADAYDELLKFPLGAHDDLVDALAHLGMGLDRLVSPEGATPDNRPKYGTMDYLKWESKQRQLAAARRQDGF